MSALSQIIIYGSFAVFAVCIIIIDYQLGKLINHLRKFVAVYERLKR